MERFVRVVLAGGLVLVAGLWAARLLEAWTIPWLAAVAVSVLGVVGLGGGIATEIEL